MTPPDPVESPWTLAELGRPAAAVIVWGVPGPQGSKRYKGHAVRRLRDGSTKRVPVLEEESAKVEPWRQAVSGSFRARVGSAWVPLDGPVVLDVVFTVRRPTGAPKTRRVRPDRSPDLDKLLRATCDGLTEGGLWVDDGRLVAFRRLEELYAGDEDPDALTSSGAVIRAWLAPVTTIGGRS